MRLRPLPLPLSIIIIATAGCTQHAPELPITNKRTATVAPKPFKADVTTAERFAGLGMMRNPGGQAHGQPDAGLDYTLPPGWSEGPPARMRLINLETESGVECYLSHTGGNLLANVNRWLGQLGEDGIDATALEDMPTLRVLDQDAVYFEREGSFKGKHGSLLVGILLPHVLKGRPGLLTVKLVGPVEAVKGEIERFQAFCGSLKPKDPHAGHNHPPGQHPGEEDPHAGHDHPPGQHPGEQQSPHGPSGPDRPTLKLEWTTPRGWNQEAPRPMREVTFKVGETECYVAALRGAGGGVEANAKRWRQQLGVDVPLNYAGLPRVPMLGRNGIIIRAEGTYTDMKEVEHEDYALLGAICKVEGMTVFVKMIGPKDEVDGQREAFMGFCESLKQGQ